MQSLPMVSNFAVHGHELLVGHKLKQLKLLFLIVFSLSLHLGEKYTYIAWKSRCLGVNKLPSSSCCISRQNLSWSVLLEKLAKAIDFKAQIKWVWVKRTLRFQANLVRVSRIYQVKAEPKYNLVVRFVCICWIRLSLTAHKLDSGVLNNCH